MIKFKIDSIRFQKSNFYYISKIDLYKKLLRNAKKRIGSRKKKNTRLKKEHNRFY